MYKILISIFFLTSVLNAGLINAVAIKVNDKIITLHDIDETMQVRKTNKKDAITFLVDKTLFEDEISKKNISVDIFDINNYLEKLARANNMELYSFKSLVKQKYPDEKKFNDEIKQRILKEKLTASLIRGKLNIANKEDMRRYYDNNSSEFETSVSTDVTQYASKNKKDLFKIKKNPMVRIKGLNTANTVLENSKISSQLKYILNETKEGSFTSIFTSNKHYVMLYVKKKNGLVKQNFEDVKNLIFTEIMQNEEKKFLDEHFKKIRSSANVEILR